MPSASAADEILPLLVGYLDDVAQRTAARTAIDGGVAVTMDPESTPVTAGSSSPLAWQVDQMQYEIGVGPCLHALRTGEGLYVADLGADHRWKDYGPRAAALGAASCVSSPVLVGGRVVAVMKAYSRTIDGISPDQQAVIAEVALEISGGIDLARHLTSQARELDDRTAAMDTRRTIDLALGVLVERTDCTVAEAFSLLRRYSQQFNVKLNEAARQVLADKIGAEKVGADSDVASAPFARPAGA